MYEIYWNGKIDAFNKNSSKTISSCHIYFLVQLPMLKIADYGIHHFYEGDYKTNAIVIFTTNPRFMPFIQLFKGGRSGPDVTFWFTVP